MMQPEDVVLETPRVCAGDLRCSLRRCATPSFDLTLWARDYKPEAFDLWAEALGTYLEKHLPPSMLDQRINRMEIRRSSDWTDDVGKQYALVELEQRILRALPSPVNGLLNAILAGDEAKVDQMAASMDINQSGATNSIDGVWWPLPLAARFARDKILKTLLARGANLELDQNHDALAQAAEGGSLPCLRTMLDAGASCRRMAGGRSALHGAALATRNAAKIVALLIERGADPKVLDASGVSPLKAALRNGNPEAMRALLDGGAEPGDITAGEVEKVCLLLSDHDSGDKPIREIRRIYQELTAPQKSAAMPSPQQLQGASSIMQQLFERHRAIQETDAAPDIDLLLGRLAQAGVEEDRIQKIRGYLACFRTPDDPFRASLVALFDYVSGASTTLPSLPADLRYRMDGFFESALSPVETTWNLRALEAAVQVDALPTLANWAAIPDGNTVFPDPDLEVQRLERVAFLQAALPTAGAADVDVARHLIHRLGSDGCECGRLTPMGSRLLASASSHLEALCAPESDSVVHTWLLGMLIAAGQEVPSALRELRPEKPAQRAFLAAAMVAQDAKRFELQIHTLLEGITQALPLFQVGVAYVRSREATFQDAGWKLLEQAFTHTSLTPSMRKEFVLKLMTEDPVKGSELAQRLYREPNTATRLSCFENALQHFQEAAVPLVVKGLCEPWDKQHIYGDLSNHTKYVSKLVKLLKPYDLASHRPVIDQAFANVQDEKVEAALRTHRSLGTPKRSSRASSGS